MTVAEVMLWGRVIGAVNWDRDAGISNFEYEAKFIQSGIEVAPTTMPLSAQIYAFPALPRETFHGLPGLLADSLPDDFGNALINAWLAREGRSPESFDPVERFSIPAIGAWARWNTCRSKAHPGPGRNRSMSRRWSSWLAKY